VSRGSRLISMSIFGKIGQSYVEILTFFNFSKWRATLSLIFKFVKFHWQTVAQTHHRAKCRQNWSSVVETLQFFEFSKWPPPPSWIVEFYWLTVSGGPRRIIVLISSKSVVPLRRYCNCAHFQNGGHRHLNH